VSANTKQVKKNINDLKKMSKRRYHQKLEINFV
jgi:hypothetical protein